VPFFHVAAHVFRCGGAADKTDHAENQSQQETRKNFPPHNIPPVRQRHFAQGIIEDRLGCKELTGSHGSKSLRVIEKLSSQRGSEPIRPTIGRDCRECIPIGVFGAGWSRSFSLSAKRVFKKQGQRINRFYGRYATPSHALMIRVFVLFRSNNNVAGQAKGVSRGKIDPAQKRRRTVIVVRVVPTSYKSGAHAQRFERWIGKQTAQVTYGDRIVKRERTRYFVVIAPWRGKDFHS
jgi:hypothetical protein